MYVAFTHPVNTFTEKNKLISSTMFKGLYNDYVFNCIQAAFFVFDMKKIMAPPSHHLMYADMI